MSGQCIIWNKSGSPQKYYIICETPTVNPDATYSYNKPPVDVTILGASGEIPPDGTSYFSCPSSIHAICQVGHGENAPFVGTTAVKVDLCGTGNGAPGSIAVVSADSTDKLSISCRQDEPSPEFLTSHVYCNWNGKQPFFPLFFEWEAVYYHIPFNQWEIQHGASSIARDMPTMRYSIKSEADITNITDTRVLSGRNIILPQAGNELANDFARLLDRMAGAGEKPVDDSNPAGWPALMKDLPILSGLMKGLRAHLTTRISETHTKPTVHIPGKHPTVLDSAAEEAGFSVKDLLLVGDETGLTPYGNSVAFDPNLNHCPFKPVTHGQMVLTKFNVVDRFGQVLAGLPDQGGPKLKGKKLQWIYPCIGEEFKPSTRESENTIVPLIVLPEPDVDKCGVFQLPPGINQSARLNGCYVIPNARNGTAKWKPANEWDNPVWGWLVLNYADYGLQIFDADGAFCCEVRLGGPDGTSRTLALKKKKTGAGPSQLDNFITMLENESSFKLVSNAINYAIANSHHVPASHAGFLHGLIGRPLALANMGWSLELGEPVLENQATGAVDQDDLLTYEFGLKLGDREKKYDGLVGYFGTDLSSSELDPAKLFPFSPPEYPKIKPYYPSALPTATIADIAAQHNDALHIFGGIIDPYSSVHASTGILPIKAIKLSPWVVEAAMRKITTFFRLGPLLVTDDLPKPTAFLENLPTTNDIRSSGTSKVELPAITPVDKWSWLQPYLVDGEEKFVVAGLANPGSLRPKWEKTPYTALEGYLLAFGQNIPDMSGEE